MEDQDLSQDFHATDLGALLTLALAWSEAELWELMLGGWALVMSLLWLANALSSADDGDGDPVPVAVGVRPDGGGGGGANGERAASASKSVHGRPAAAAGFQ